MEASIIGAAAAFVTVAGPVLVYLMRVEHRITAMEITVRERLPARAA